MQEQLHSFLQKNSDLDKHEITAFCSLWNKKLLLKRNDYLIPAGKIETHIYFINSGLLRIYFPVKTEEICVGFAYSQNMVCSFPSFIDNQPSEFAIQALKKSEVLVISKPDFMRFLNENQKFERFWRKIMEQLVLGRIEREIDLLLPEPELRLKRLLSRSPHIFQFVPKKYIASYLRMSPETLSRMRYS